MIPIVVGTLAALVIHHARSGNDADDYESAADPTYHETLLNRWVSLDWSFAAPPSEVPAPVAPLPAVEPPMPVLKDALRKVKL